MSEIKRIGFFYSALDLLSEYSLVDGSAKTVDSLVTEDGQLRSCEGPAFEG